MKHVAAATPVIVGLKHAKNNETNCKPFINVHFQRIMGPQPCEPYSEP